jgi:hypothetical protein
MTKFIRKKRKSKGMSIFGSKEVVTVAALVSTLVSRLSSLASRFSLLAVADVLARSRMYAHEIRDLRNNTLSLP